MPTIYDYVVAKELATNWNINADLREPYLGEAFFPNKKHLGLDLTWIKGSRKAPVSLSLSAFDAKVIPLNREGFEKLATEMPFFKNSMIVDEKQRQELNKVIASGNQSAIDLILSEIYNDEMHLLEDASLTREIMRMQLLTTGVVALANNGQTYSYDYKLPTTHKITVTNKWDTADTSDPIKDITDAVDLIVADTGKKPTRGLINSTTLNLIRNSKAVKNAIYVLANGTVTPNRARTLQYLTEETGVTFYVYDKGYMNGATRTKFIPDGVVTLFPEGDLGNTYFGTTPEESDLISSSVANVSIVDSGVAITTTKQTDPVNVVTKVSMICLPSFEMADSIAILDVT